MLNAQGLALDQGGIRLRGVAAQTPFHARSKYLELPGFRASLLGGSVTGRLTLADWERYQVDGEAAGLDLAALKELPAGQRDVVDRMRFTGAASGSLRASGSIRRLAGLRVGADFSIAPPVQPSTDGVPLAGVLAFDYDYDANRMAFRESHIELPSTRVHFNGAIETGIDVGLFTRDTSDLLPAIAMLSAGAPKELPVGLQRGTASFQGASRARCGSRQSPAAWMPNH
jgi:hypothetical protein